MTRPLYVHVGSRKTGTSGLQGALWTSTEELAAAGLGLPLVGRPAHVRELVGPLGWVPGSSFDNQIDRRSLGRLGVRLRRTPGERLLLTNEDLAEAGPAQISAFMETVEAADVDVRVVVTARDWAQQLPSEWQQLLKSRLTMEYETFLAQVRDRDGQVGERFWLRHDVLDICERWGGLLTPARVHVIAVPPATVDPDAIYRLFGEVVGFDPSLLAVARKHSNASLGYTEAEMLRRLNLALGDRLPDFENEYLPAIRSVLIRRVIARGASTRIPLPPDHVDWVRKVSDERLTTLVEHGYRVHGDHTLLVPPPDVGRAIPDISGTEIADAALRTLADFAIVQFRNARKDPARAARRSGRSKPVARRRSKLGRTLLDRIMARDPGRSKRVSAERRQVRRDQPVATLPSSPSSPA